MTKKFIISFLAAVVFVGLTVFAYAQDATPPSDSKVIVCEDYAQMIVFDENGEFLYALFGTVDGEGVFHKDDQDPYFDYYKGYVCSDDTYNDCRFIRNNETTYFCGSLGGGTSGVFWRK